jgi:hypothetical protein
VVSDSRSHIDRDFINRSDHTNANSNLLYCKANRGDLQSFCFPLLMFTCHLDVLHAFIFSTPVMFPILLHFSPCFLLLSSLISLSDPFIFLFFSSLSLFLPFYSLFSSSLSSWPPEPQLLSEYPPPSSPLFTL